MTADATRPRGTFLADVLANETLCEEHLLLRLAVEGFPPSRPGQFVQVQCNEPAADAPRPREVPWGPDTPPKLTGPELTEARPLLRRPFSLAGRRDRPDGRAELDLIYRVVGAGTAWLEGLAPGPAVSVLGPLGNGFAIDPDRPAAALVGGGVGIPPMLYLAEALTAAGKDVQAFCGVRSEHLLPLRLTGEAEASPLGEPAMCVAEFAAHGVEAAIATDDGSLGWRGLLPDALRRRLDDSPAAAEGLVVYTCGPEAMMRAVGELCIERGIPCQVALERHMACGMGTCQSCVFRMRADNEQGWTYRLVCTDGPVFDARDVLWD